MVAVRQPKSRYQRASTLRNRALTRALHELHSVVGADEASMRSMRQLLVSVLEDQHAFATITSDGDDGLIAQWRAGRSYIAIEINAHEISLTYADHDGRLVENLAAATTQHLGGALQRSLDQFTASLNGANPSWRDHFA